MSRFPWEKTVEEKKKSDSRENGRVSLSHGARKSGPKVASRVVRFARPGDRFRVQVSSHWDSSR